MADQSVPSSSSSSGPSAPASGPGRVNMRFPLKSALVCFSAVLVLYTVFYYGIENSRTKPGAWEVTFLAGASSPGIQVHHPTLLSHNITFTFPGETNSTPLSSNVLVRFDRPRTPVPFGTNVFEDLMFLPGVVVLNLFGHEIQLAPRTLVLNRREVPWTNLTEVTLYPSNRLSAAELQAGRKK